MSGPTRGQTTKYDADDAARGLVDEILSFGMDRGIVQRALEYAYAAGQAAEIAKMPPAPPVVDTSHIDSEALEDAIKSMKSAMSVIFARTPRLDEIAAAVAAEREECAKVCDELEQHWSDYKDTALLNGDVDLSNAASGEPRAARAISAAIRARGGK